MSLYKDWKELTESQTKKTFKEFWDEYSSTEKRIYSDILDQVAASTKNVPLTDDSNDGFIFGSTQDAPKWNFSGNVGEMIEKYEAKPEIFVGFLDGIQESIEEKLDLESIDSASDISIDIDMAKLYYNMLTADAEYLYRLPQGEDILGVGTMAMLVKKYKKSKTVVKEKKIGRNDPCPCGSGKKYKNCCGRGK